MIFKDGKVLLGKRIGSHGSGKYAFPGGHLEYLEGFSDCARREVLEESGIEIQDVRFQCILNSNKFPDRHYVTIILIANWKSGEPAVLEPEKNELWQWHELDNLPTPIFEASAFGLKSLETGENYFDN